MQISGSKEDDQAIKEPENLRNEGDINHRDFFLRDSLTVEH
jgi:hypothetical protein